MDNYNRGNNGYGVQVGSNARGWQEYARGQQERQRRLDQEQQQRQNQERQRQLNQDRQRQLDQGNVQARVQGQSDESYFSNGSESESSGAGYAVFCVLVFVGAAVYGLTLLDASISPETGKMLTQYIGPDGYVSKNVFFWSFVAMVTVIGVLIRKIIQWVVGIGIVSGIVWGVVQLIID